MIGWSSDFSQRSLRPQVVKEKWKEGEGKGGKKKEEGRREGRGGCLLLNLSLATPLLARSVEREVMSALL